MLPPGTVLADRFVIEQHAGRGGMGSVYKAQDLLHGGQPVAIKLLHSTESPQALRRFTREAKLLLELRHPGIVTYVAHGVAEGLQPFLAMEWLEGESLAQRLSRQPLDTAQILIMFRRIVEALDAAHQRGIIHRDIKPSNLFLRSGRVEDVVLLDFGLARHIVPSQILTGDTMLLGTPGYMAPEQASGGQDITPSTDVFALGCVLYECLTGQPPFVAPILAAVLAKLLFVEPPPLSSLRQDLPSSWQRLLDSMLAKDATQRPRDAMSLQAAFLVLAEASPGGPSPFRVERSSAVGPAGVEQQLVSVLVATPPVPLMDAPTLTLSEKSPQSHPLLDSLRTELEAHGAQGTQLADGSLLAMFLPEQGVATDQAVRAARCALFLKERWTEARVVLATGRGLLGERTLVGEAMDRAGELQRWLRDGSISSAAYPVLDELTAGLLGPGFLLAPARPGAFLLRGEHLSADETRPLLGRPTPCVGRERELSMLELAFSACAEESSARALLVTAPAGMGKSRLRHEFLRRLERQGQRVLVLQGRAEPVHPEATDGLLAQALRRLCGIQDGERLEARWEKFTQRISRHLAPEQARTTTELLGELCGLSSLAEDSPRLRAARRDPPLMSAQVARALVSFLRAECEHGPVLLVLEDLHWGDALTVKLVDEALRELYECPLMVLALARPEVKSTFPDLWSRCLSELSLSALNKRAGAQLIQEVLGADLPQAVTDRIISQAGGNALFLEELIRAVKEGRGESPPSTVLAMLHARILRLEPEARQVLLAASFFGHTFWSAGVKSLLAPDLAGERLERWLRLLVESEMIEPQPESRFPAEQEFRFRHALLGDAAQELVPASYKPTGHQRVGEWLVSVGEPDPLVLADHFQLGQELKRAVHFYNKAAERCLGPNLPRLIRSLEAAVTSGASTEVKAQLRRLQSMVYSWTGDIAQALESGAEALRELKAGSSPWCQLITSLIYGSLNANEPARAMELGLLLLAHDPDEEALESYVESVCFMASMAVCRGARAESMGLMARALEVSARKLEQNLFLRGVLQWIQALFTWFLEARPWQARVLAEQATQAFRKLGLEWKQITALAVEGLALAWLGDWASAAEKLHEGQALARLLGRPREVHYSDLHVILVLSGSPEAAHREEARALALEWVGRPSPNPGASAVEHLALCRLTADPREAEAHGRKACELASIVYFQHHAHITLSGFLLTQGRVSEARQLAAVAVQEWTKTGGAGSGAIGVYLGLAEACFAEGDAEAGDAALRQALHCLKTRTDDIPDPAARERFLRQVPENARLLELARQRSLPASGMELARS